jgi:uncharacterized protein YdhG (YjbR/CyaY superfamily)
MRTRMAHEVDDIEDYIAHQPKNVRPMLERLRRAVRSAAPDAQEVISYGMPSFKYHGRLVYFAAFKNHIGFYPRASGIEAFKKELSRFEGTHGSVKFPLDKPLPIALIKKIVRFRVAENRKNS